MDHKFKSKWENNNNNYNFDKDYGYDCISWRQRSFMCNFCKKEYKSAQALGGHMNVHRRDRARLSQSSPSQDHSNPNPNPNPNFSSPPSSMLCHVPFKAFHSSLFSLDISSPPSLSMKNEEKHEQKMFPFVSHSAWDFLGDMRKNVKDDQGNESRVGKKRDQGLLKDGSKINEVGLDLELRLGRS